MNKLHLDFETRSTLDIKKVGAAAYAAHSSTDITCMGVASGDRPVRVWAGRAVRAPIKLIYDDERIVAHSVLFEYFIYHFILHKRYGWPELLDPTRWDCTQARALMCGLPASLEGLAYALKLDFQKDLDGRSAMLATCKPKADGTWNEDPATLERLYRYNAIDVETERAADKKLPELPESERKAFELNILMNRRGIAIDVRSAKAGQEIAAVITKKLNSKLDKLTDGAVSAATQIAGLKRWITAQGIAIPTKTKTTTEEDGTVTEEEKETLDKEAVGDLLKDAAVPQNVKDAIVIRQQVGKSSVSKFTSMLNAACGDGRVRGAVQYHGAHTGRDAGRLIQPQNYPQGLVGAEQEQAIELLNEGPEMFAAVYEGRSMQTLSDVLRGMLVPGPGLLFLGADYNAIECRVLNWLAGEKWVLDLFARGESPYIQMAESIYNRTGISKKGTPREYEIGKRSELGGGFGMGWIRFQASTYTETSKTGEGVWLEDELSQRIIKIYRSLHPRVVGLWYATEAAAVRAVLNPGKLFPCADGRVLWGMSEDRRFLVCKLPSGRFLRYFRPSVRQETDRRGNPKSVLYYWTSAGEGAIKTDCNGFLGLYKTWGGELVENYVQAIARDIMVNGEINVTNAGYKLVLPVHDELLAEIEAPPPGCGPDPEIVDDFTQLMCQAPAWAAGLPIAAEGWIGRRYRK